MPTHMSMAVTRAAMYSETLVPTQTLSNMLRPNSSVPNQNPESEGVLYCRVEVLPDGGVGREPGADEGQGEDEDDDAAGGDRDAVPLQPPPGVAPEAHRGAC